MHCLYIAGASTVRNSGNTDASLRYWNFSWIAEDVLGFPEDTSTSLAPGPVGVAGHTSMGLMCFTGFECSSEGKPCQGKTESYHPEFAWSLTSAEDVWAEDHGVMDMARGSSQGWEEAMFLIQLTASTARKETRIRCCIVEVCKLVVPQVPKLFRKDPKAFPGQPRDIVSPACPGSSPWSLPGGACPEHLPRETSRRHPKQMPEPPQLSPFDVEEQWLYSELLLGDRAP
ncbi:hypothetical protein QTP86_011118 [Hemibagrus guttatus]|nr:hypothetical protein QTP86_011118 [Hemibagrus guttatus]